MLTYTHVYDDPRVFPMGETLVKLGYQVQIIGIALRKNLPTENRVSGIDIFITPLVAKGGFVSFVRAFWHWMKGDMYELEPDAEERLTNKYAAILFNLWILRIGLRKKPSAIHSHTHSPLPAAWLLARLYHIPLIYDSCESVPDLFQQFPNTFMNRVTNRLETLLMPKADAVITVGERLAKKLAERGARHIVIIGNWKSLEKSENKSLQISNLSQSQFDINDNQLIISYFGNLSASTYDLQPLLEAIKHSPDVALVIAGTGDLRSEIINYVKETPNIHWLDWISASDIAIYTQLADAVYCCLKPDFSQAYYVVPNKLFDALQAGKPVIARKGVGEMSEIIEVNQVGILVDEVTPTSLQAAFRQLQDPIFHAELQRRSRAAREQYSWSIAEERLKSLYNQLIPPQ